MDQCVRDSVEGQSTSRTVHIHCYSVGGGGGEGRGRGGQGGGKRDIFCSLVVPKRIIIFSADQTPALIIPAEPAVCTLSFPADSFVSHCYDNRSFTLHLPVTTPSQTSSTQQLPAAAVKPLWMIRIWLLVSHHCHLPVVVGQVEVSVRGVWVHLQFTEN